MRYKAGKLEKQLGKSEARERSLDRKVLELKTGRRGRQGGRLVDAGVQCDAQVVGGVHKGGSGGVCGGVQCGISGGGMDGAVLGCRKIRAERMEYGGWQGCVRYDYEGMWSRSDYVCDGEVGRMRLECRGLVLGSDGCVRVRPVHKAFDERQMEGMWLWEGLHGRAVVEVMEKLDGQLIVGVVNDKGEVEMWSRKGRTEVGKGASVFAQEHGGYESLVREVEARGATVCFEMVGKQSKVKVRYGSRDLVVIAVRSKVGGGYWRHSEMVDIGGRHGVSVVRKFEEGLEGKRLKDVSKWVAARGGEWEGVMVVLDGGVHVKVKTDWWLREEVSGGGWRKGLCEALAKRREVRHGRFCEDRRLRMVVNGLSVQEAAVRVFKWAPEIVKVEACYNARSGVRGAVIASVRTEQEAVDVRGRLRWKAAHSNRCRETELQVVKRWWRGEVE